MKGINTQKLANQLQSQYRAGQPIPNEVGEKIVALQTVAELLLSGLAKVEPLAKASRKQRKQDQQRNRTYANLRKRLRG